MELRTQPPGISVASLAIHDGWAGPCGTMWRLAHDPVRHVLHARKPFCDQHWEHNPQKRGAYEGPLAEEG